MEMQNKVSIINKSLEFLDKFEQEPSWKKDYQRVYAYFGGNTGDVGSLEVTEVYNACDWDLAKMSCDATLKERQILWISISSYTPYDPVTGNNEKLPDGEMCCVFKFGNNHGNRKFYFISSDDPESKEIVNKVQAIFKKFENSTNSPEFAFLK